MYNYDDNNNDHNDYINDHSKDDDDDDDDDSDDEKDVYIISDIFSPSSFFLEYDCKELKYDTVSSLN